MGSRRAASCHPPTHPTSRGKAFVPALAHQRLDNLARAAWPDGMALLCHGQRHGGGCLIGGNALRQSVRCAHEATRPRCARALDSAVCSTSFTVLYTDWGQSREKWREMAGSEVLARGPTRPYYARGRQRRPRGVQGVAATRTCSFAQFTMPIRLATKSGTYLQCARASGT